MAHHSTLPGPRVLDALSLLSEVADQVVVASARDTHLAWAGRAHGLTRRLARGSAGVPTVVEKSHVGIASAVYGGLGLGLRAGDVAAQRQGGGAEAACCVL